MSTLPRPACIPIDVWTGMPDAVAATVSAALAAGVPCAAALPGDVLMMVPQPTTNDLAHVPPDAPATLRHAERDKWRQRSAAQSASFMRALAFFLTVRRAL